MSASDQLLQQIAAHSLGLDIDRENHRYYWNDKRVMSVTDITRRWALGPRVEAMILGAARGSRVEAAVESFYRDGGAAFTELLEDEDWPFFDSFIDWMDEEGQQFRPVGFQVPFRFSPNPAFDYCGTMDMIGDWQGPEEAVVLDLKTMSDTVTSTPKEYRLQIAGYAGACSALLGRPVRGGLLILQPGRKGRIEWGQPEDIPAFVNALGVAMWFKGRTGSAEEEEECG